VSEKLKIWSAAFIGIAFGVLFVAGANRGQQYVVIVTRGDNKECFVRTLKSPPQIHCSDSWITVAGVTAEIGAKVEVVAAK
jgi:hypothetical protein